MAFIAQILSSTQWLHKYFLAVFFLMTENDSPKKRGPERKGKTKRTGTNIAMNEETKEELTFIQKKLGNVSRSEAIARVVHKVATLLQDKEEDR